MKILAAMALSCCLSASVPEVVSQTKNELPRYTDTDGYKVLSAVIDARTEKSKDGSVPIFRETVSGVAVGKLVAECSGRFPREFQTALADLRKMTKTKFVLQRQFSLHKEYKFVEGMVGVHAGTYSVSVAGFNEYKTHAVVLVQYLVRPPGSVILDGSTIVYLLRRTETGWQRATDVPECGRIY